MGSQAFLVAIAKVEGVMYLHHNYPKLYKEDTRTGNEDKNNPFRKELVRTHQCEVWQVPDDVYPDIHDMEIGSGYVAETIKGDFSKKEAIIFWMPWEEFDPRDKWIEKYTYAELPEDVREYLKRNMSNKPLQ